MSRASRLIELARAAEEAARAGREAVEVVEAGKTISPTAVQALADRARLDTNSRKALEGLAEARRAVETDAYAHRALIRESIARMAGEEQPDPEQFLSLVFAATASELQNGDPALPLFFYKRDLDPRWKNQSLTVPSVRREHGKLQTRGVVYMIPATSDDVICLGHVRTIRECTRHTLLKQMCEDGLVNLRQLAWLALCLMPLAGLWSMSQANNAFENTSDDEVVVRCKDNRKFCFIEVEEGLLVMEVNDITRQFCRAYREKEEYEKNFWAGKIDVAKEIAEIVCAGEDVITPEEFLRGEVGSCAIRHSAWHRRRGADIQVIVLFERRKDGAWRWVFCNPEGVRELFGGRRLQFRQWGREDVPPYLVALLRGGVHIVPANMADILGYECPGVSLELE